jgi:hypothetical protein
LWSFRLACCPSIVALERPVFLRSPTPRLLLKDTKFGREFTRKKQIIFDCVPLYQCERLCIKSKSHHGCTRITRIYKLKNPNRTFVIRANQHLSVLSVVRVGFLYKANERYRYLSLKVIVAKWISRYARDEKITGSAQSCPPASAPPWAHRLPEVAGATKFHLCAW